MKVSELNGPLLDYWVAKAEGYEARIHPDTFLDGTPTSYCIADRHPYSPSTDWSQGGPIIERERIGVVSEEDGGRWMARRRRGEMGYIGQTPLIAAMRAYIASKFGEEVPDEGRE